VEQQLSNPQTFGFADEGTERKPSDSPATAFDFRRPDRISKSQVRAIYVLHENLVRSLMSDLSAYLRTYIVMNLVSVEQVSYAEFLEGLPPSTFLACLGMKPYEGAAVLEINPSLVFPILEVLLGGTGKTYTSIQREVTEIEQSLMDGFLRIMLRNLAEAWRSVTGIDFSIESLDTEPQFLQVMSANEAVVAIGIEMRMGESSGLINIAMPSLMMKMIRHKFDQQWSLRKTAATPDEQARVLRLLQPSQVRVEARLQDQTLLVQDLTKLKAGDVLIFDHPVEKPVTCSLNGRSEFAGHIVRAGRKCALRISDRTAGGAANQSS
jgi:flagellar motor switch protein FliM